MIPDELRATAAVGARVATDVVSVVEGVHRAVARRALGPFGTAALPARTVHNGVAAAVYQGVRWGTRLSGAAAGQALYLLGPASGPAGRTRRGNQALSVLNAFAGDRLARDGSALAIRTAVRREGADVPVESDALRAAFPTATPRVAVLVHGLAETEMSWRPVVADGSQVDYTGALRSELGYTPAHVRYNSGRHVSENGAELCDLLGRLADRWPVAPEEILLVGHSMGGLVIRSACHIGALESRSWVSLVRHVVYLGTPHLGAPLARVAGLAGWGLSRLPETRPFAPLVNGSSDGVKDLRFGYLSEQDWSGCESDECRRDHRTDTPLLATANHYTFGVTLSARPTSLGGRLVGDLLVQPSSAHGRRRRRQAIPFPPEGRRRLGGLNHFDLLRSPEVWNEVRALLAPAADVDGCASGG